jgi:hypothetical protein
MDAFGGGSRYRASVLLAGCACVLLLAGCSSSPASAPTSGGTPGHGTTTGGHTSGSTGARAPSTTGSTGAPSGRVVVPETVGTPLPTAEAQLARLGLRTSVKTVPVPEEPEQDCVASDVVAQKPEPGSEVLSGSVVTLATCTSA